MCGIYCYKRIQDTIDWRKHLHVKKVTAWSEHLHVKNVTTRDLPSACPVIMQQPWPLFWTQIFREGAVLEQGQLQEQKTAHTWIKVHLQGFKLKWLTLIKGSAQGHIRWTQTTYRTVPIQGTCRRILSPWQQKPGSGTLDLQLADDPPIMPPRQPSRARPDVSFPQFHSLSDIRS